MFSQLIATVINCQSYYIYMQKIFCYISEKTIILLHAFNLTKCPHFHYYTPPRLIKLLFKSQDPNLNIGATLG